jgi:aspartate 1-decarboxylase
LRKADIREFEEVVVLDIDNGARFTTYAIVGEPGEICLNGAAARLVHRGDKVIILTFADVAESEVDELVPNIVIVDEENTPVG